MKIKPPSRKHLIKSLLRKLTTHYWLLPELPKKKGRLGQLNKFNTKRKTTSEFIVMCNKMEAQRAA